MADRSDLPAIGFIGLGNMGIPMARRLLDAGFSVRGHDVSAQARATFEKDGGVLAASAADALKGSDVCILMLPDSSVVCSVVDEAAFLQSLHPGITVVDMGSSEPVITRRLATLLDQRAAILIDAPVSGGVRRAQTGELSIMVGGPESVVVDLQPVFAVLGTSVHVGPVGSGHAVKALNNLLSAVHLWATSEAMVVGMSFGLDPEVMLRVFNMSSGRSGSTENKWPNYILSNRYDSGFGLSLMIKDMKIAVGLASRVGRPSDLGGTAVELWERAERDLGPDADHTEIAHWLFDQLSSSSDNEERRHDPS